MKITFNFPKRRKKFKPIESGRYPASLISFKPNQSVEYGESYEFRFEIISGRYVEQEIARFLKVDETMQRWVGILSGKPYDEITECESDDLIRAECLIEVELTVDKKNRIMDIYPLKKE